MKNKIIDGIMFVLFGNVCYACASLYIDSFKFDLLFSQRVAMITGYIMACYFSGVLFGKLGNKIKNLNNKKGEIK